MEFASHRDDWGVPHLRAATARGLAFAQGWNAAADRPRQLEIARRRAEGTSAALLGTEAVAWDRFARQALIADTARRCFEALDPDTAAWVAAYVDGVDQAGPEHWEPWVPLSIWLAEHLLFGAGFPAKLWRHLAVAAYGEDAARLFAIDGPASPGSNAWLVTGDRTASGAPILAGDPHRVLEFPGIYQQIHLACDEFDVVGLAVPGVPGIAHFGHTGSVAWGITNAMADHQDLYEEHLGSVPVTERTETIEVAGAAPETVTVAETERGPLIAACAGRGTSLRYPARVLGDLGFAALPALLRSRTVADVDAALDRWVAPVNVVLAADDSGGTLHRVAGRVPDRDPAGRLRPQPARSPASAWHGWLPMPRADVDTIAVAANERGLAGPLGVEFAPPHRADRIRELLELSNAWTPEAMACIHTDTLLGSAGPLLEELSKPRRLSPAAARMRVRLVHWDRRMEAHSVEAAEYAALRAAVARSLAEHPKLAPMSEWHEWYPEVFAPWFDARARIGFALEHLLRHEGFRLLVPQSDLDEIVRDAAEEVAATATGAPWGEVHLLAPWDPRPPGSPGPGPWPGVAGDHDCVLSTGTAPDGRCVRGPAARWVWDLADRGASRWIVPFGAAEGDGHPHARDQLPLWRAGELAPVVTDWNRLTEEHRVSRAVDPADRAAVHDRALERFGRVRLVPVDPGADLDLVHGWVTEERARFWGMTGYDRERVRQIYEFLDSLPTHHAYLVLRDRVPVALFQTYEPDADPVGECYDARPGDIGVHLLVARPDRDRSQAGFTAALMSALLGFAFKDPSRRRVVVEPDARNAQARARMLRSGFTLGPEIDLPDKRAQLAFLEREAWERG
ncbi:GNAT family N-acetyltransferase [Glycomyces xiaoerkulensis]|uniref:GNAT family N-acetyltransferase n=1 Tax=Glycomyces xiaoerkulensis TaxID=2038139 RepID=UPI000C256618|nr:GNAT family N-acetyltransferase [Glycomyces xiaoerkulensis]